MSRNTLLKGLVLGGPFLLFPFSRSFYVFFVAILVWGALEARAALWRQHPAPRLAFMALALPVAWTILGWTLFQGGPDPDWFGKLGVMVLGGVLAMATITLSRDEAAARVAFAVAGLAVLTWIGDGLLQMATGHSIDCRGPLSACYTDGRLSLYFGTRAKLGYYMGLMVFIPVAWLLARGRPLLAALALAGGGALAMAGGVRFSMLAFLAGSLALALVLVWRSAFPLLAKSLMTVGVPVLVALLGVVFYHANDAFQARIDTTLVGFRHMDREAWNVALSGRLDIWEPLLAMVREHWLFGVGPGTLDAGIRPYLGAGNLFSEIKIFHAHQVVLDVAAATGLAGLLGFLAFYGWVLREFLRASREALDLRWAALLVLLLMWFPLNSSNGFYASDMLLLTFFMLGLGFGFRPGGDGRAGQA